MKKSRLSSFRGNEDNEPLAALSMHCSCSNRGDRAGSESGVASWAVREEDKVGDVAFGIRKKKHMGWSLSLALCMLTQLLMYAMCVQVQSHKFSDR